MNLAGMENYILAVAAIAVVRSLFFTGDFWGLMMAVGLGVALMVVGVPALTATGIASIGYIVWDLYQKYVEVKGQKRRRRAKEQANEAAWGATAPAEEEASQAVRKQSNLVSCLKCGKDISVNADRCPACDFVNATCKICVTRIAPNDLLALPEGYVRGRNRPLHRSCVDKLFAYDGGAKCRACGQSLAAPWVASIVNTALIEQIGPSELHMRILGAACPNCGEPHILGHRYCDYCELPVLSTQAHMVDDGAWHLLCQENRRRPAAG